VKTSKLDTWINKILATEDEEISCSQCFDLLAGYVDAEMMRRPILEDNLKVKQHIYQCQVCQEEYEILRHLAQLDAEGDDSSLQA
jgi:hypothetical protein